MSIETFKDRRPEENMFLKDTNIYTRLSQRY